MKCECLIAGFCERRQHNLTALHWSKCQAGHVEMLDKIYAQLAVAVPQTGPSSPMVVRSGIGDRMAAIIERETGEHIPCADCSSDIGKLNFMTAEAVLGEINLLAETIQQRAKDLAPALYQRLFASLAPVATQHIVRGWIREACGET